jgi:hypothetical protein
LVVFSIMLAFIGLISCNGAHRPDAIEIGLSIIRIIYLVSV